MKCRAAGIVRLGIQINYERTPGSGRVPDIGSTCSLVGIGRLKIAWGTNARR